MEAAVVLETKDVRKIIAKFFGVEEDKVIKSQYTYTVKGITGEQSEKLKSLM